MKSLFGKGKREEYIEIKEKDKEEVGCGDNLCSFYLFICLFGKKGGVCWDKGGGGRLWDNLCGSRIRKLAQLRSFLTDILFTCPAPTIMIKNSSKKWNILYYLYIFCQLSFTYKDTHITIKQVKRVRLCIKIWKFCFQRIVHQISECPWLKV